MGSVADMEVDKVADKVADMEVDKVTDMVADKEVDKVADMVADMSKIIISAFSSLGIRFSDPRPRDNKISYQTNPSHLMLRECPHTAFRMAVWR